MAQLLSGMSEAQQADVLTQELSRPPSAELQAAMEQCPLDFGDDDYVQAWAGYR
jgi:hypothetical protein